MTTYIMIFEFTILTNTVFVHLHKCIAEVIRITLVYRNKAQIFEKIERGSEEAFKAVMQINVTYNKN